MSTSRQLGPQRVFLVVAILSTALCWVLSPPAAEGAVLDPRGIQSETLHNGLRLVVANDPDARVVAVEIVVKAGAADDPPGQKGMAHLLEHVLWSGARASGSDPRRTIEQVGGVIDAGTLRDYTRFYATVPAGHLDLAVGALAETVLQSNFDDDLVARERRIIGEEAATRAEDPRTVLNALAFAELYSPAHPYGDPIEGTPDNLNLIEAAHLAFFHRTWYVPNNMAVIVSGDAPFDAVRDLVVRIFGGLTPAALPPRSSPAPLRPSPPSTAALDLPIEKAYVMAAFIGPDVSEHTAVAATDLVATLLTHRPTGRLVTELQEKESLALSLGIDFLTQRDRALFGVWAICGPEDVDKVREVIRTQLVRLGQEAVPPVELAVAKRLLSAGFAFANETPADRAATLGFYEAIDSYRAASYYLPWVSATRAQALAKVAAWYTGEPTWVILRPESEQ